MSDREKVLKGLECCLVFGEDLLYKCDECPYRATEDERKVIDWRCHLEELRKDALELLKGQEAVEPKTGHWIESKCLDECFWVCSECNFSSEAMAAPELYKYCPNCGTKMAERR